jgi:hypothetical protein
MMRVPVRIGDPNAVTQRDRGSMLRLDAQYAKQGFRFQRGESDEDSRIMALMSLIHNDRFVVTKDCVQTFEAIKQYQWKDITPMQRAKGEVPKERPLKKNTHLVECAQFMACRQLPSLKKRDIERLTLKTFDDEVHRNIRKQLANKAAARSRGSLSHDLGGFV